MSDVREQYVERLARLEEQLRESRVDRDRLHQEFGALRGELAALARTVEQAKGGWRVFLLASGVVGFIAGTIQTWVGPGHWGR